jgi:hypothetical protein
LWDKTKGMHAQQSRWTKAATGPPVSWSAQNWIESWLSSWPSLTHTREKAEAFLSHVVMCQVEIVYIYLSISDYIQGLRHSPARHWVKKKIKNTPLCWA